jgi:hypothetical protein
MRTESTLWRRLTSQAIAGLPEAVAVFEIGNLVRNVVHIGRAEGNLRARLLAYFAETVTNSSSPGGLYFRYELVEDEEQALTARLAAYGAAHGGHLPPANRHSARTLRLAPRRAA